MREDIKKWLQALRSGDYEQTKGTLKRDLGNGKVGFCCLGVYLDACTNRPVKTVNRLSKDEGALGHYSYLRDKLDYIDGEYEGIGQEGINMNDMGDSFKEIADMIEEKLL